MFLIMVLEAQSIDSSYLFHKEADRDTKVLELAKKMFSGENVDFETLEDVIDFQASERFFDQCYDHKIIVDSFDNIN